MDNPKSGFLFQLLGQMVQTGQVRVNNLFAPGTNQMRMGIGIVTVIAVAAVTETKLQDLTYFFDQRYGFINGGQTGGRKIDFDLLINPLDTGMAIAGRQYF